MSKISNWSKGIYRNDGRGLREVLKNLGTGNSDRKQLIDARIKGSTWVHDEKPAIVIVRGRGRGYTAEFLTPSDSPQPSRDANRMTIGGSQRKTDAMDKAKTWMRNHPNP